MAVKRSKPKKDALRYVAVYEYIAGNIRSGKFAPGDRLPTEEELRSLFGVGRQTVLKALGQLKTEKMITSQQGSGSFVSKWIEPPAIERSREIGIVCSSLADGFAHQIVLGVESYLRQAGYESILCNSDYSVSNEAAHLRRLYSRGVDGILLVPYMPPANLELIESLRNDAQRPLPVVCLDRGFSGSDLPLVNVDNFQASYDAVRYLIELGHQRIGFIVANIGFLDSVETVRERYRGYRQALCDHDIRFDRDLVQEVGPVLANMRPQDVGLEQYGYQPMHKLLMLKNPPTAVFLLWDEIAPGAMAAIRNSGLQIPQDISLIGFNDDLLARLLPIPLTTIRQPAQEIGKAAAEMAVGMIEERADVVRRKTLQTELIVRSTTAAKCRPDILSGDTALFDASKKAVKAAG